MPAILIVFLYINCFFYFPLVSGELLSFSFCNNLSNLWADPHWHATHKNLDDPSQLFIISTIDNRVSFQRWWWPAAKTHQKHQPPGKYRICEWTNSTWTWLRAGISASRLSVCLLFWTVYRILWTGVSSWPAQPPPCIEYSVSALAMILEPFGPRA